MPLYCSTHTAAIYDRGGKTIIGQLENLSRVKWGRLRDDISEGLVTVGQPSKECFQLLNDIHPNRHELVIFREGQRVWEGPITHIGRHADVFQITARDVGHYLHRTACHLEHDSAAYWSPDNKDPDKVFVDNTESVVVRAQTVITEELNRKKETLTPPVNVVPYLTVVRAPDPTDERQANRRTMPFQLTVYDDIEAMATTGGLDYTVVGRRIILSDNRTVIGKTPVVTEQDFMSEVVVTSYGMDSFTRAITTGDEGMYGIYPPLEGTPEWDALDQDMKDMIEYYGEWENIEQMFDEDSVEAPTQNSLNNAAEFNMNGRLPVPTLVRVPENSRLNPNGTLNIQDLVPGVIVPVRATLTSIVLVQNQKLNNVNVEETGEGGEVITVTLGSPPAELLS